MADVRLPAGLIQRIRMRANDPQRRSDSNSMRSQTVGVEAMFDSLGSRGAQMRSIMTQITDLMASSAPRLNDLRMTTSIPIEDPSRDKFEPLPQPASAVGFA